MGQLSRYHRYSSSVPVPVPSSYAFGVFLPTCNVKPSWKGLGVVQTPAVAHASTVYIPSSVAEVFELFQFLLIAVVLLHKFSRSIHSSLFCASVRFRFLAIVLLSAHCQAGQRRSQALFFLVCFL